ncbi:MAG: DUF3768 domain-containing protein [Robiginitomaculum sp.]|nr:DUF3768 domain-containing protein [Robiginitomaculum sp.]
MASVNIADDEQRIVIRTLNDQFRKTGLGGRVTITRGVFELGQELVQQITNAVRTFDDFNPDNDPYGEHDCAAVTIDEHKVFFTKIDCSIMEREMPRWI